MATGDHMPSGRCPLQPRKLERASGSIPLLGQRKVTGAWALGGAQQAASRWNPALPEACACCAGLHAGFRSGDRSSQGDAVRGVMSRGACLFTLPGAVAGDSKTDIVQNGF